MTRLIDTAGWVLLISACYLLVALLWLPLTIGRRMGLVLA